MIARISMLVAAAAATAVLVAVPLMAQEAATPASSTAASINEAAPPVEDESILRDGVAAIVNDSVISEYDVRQRIALYYALTGAQRTPEADKVNRPRVLSQLETERIKFLEAQKKGISVNTSEVDKALERLRAQNNLSEDQLKQLLARTGANIATFRQQIAVQMAWEKLVQQQYGDRINVSDETVNAEFARAKQNAAKPFFEVSEIFLPVDTPEQDEKVKKDMQNILTQIHGGASFNAVAQQSSQSPTAAQGGDLGWIQEGQLEPVLDQAMLKLRIGEVSDPIRGVGGYYILGLRDRQEPVGTKVPTAEETATPVERVPLARLTLEIGPSPSKSLLAQAGEIAGKISASVQSCEHLKEIAGQMKGVAYFPPGAFSFGDLARDIQQKIRETAPGRAVQPFLSPAGMEILFRCDKAPPRITVAHMPTRDEIVDRITGDQLEVFGRSYLRDLRRDAQIVLPGENLKAVRHATQASTD